MDSAKGIMNAYAQTKFIPLNLEIQSVSFGDEGRQLSVVANQYQKMVTEINDEIKGFETRALDVVKKIELGQFYIGASQLMQDVVSFLRNEGENTEATESVRDLEFLSDFYLKKSEEGVKEIGEGTFAL